MILVKVVATLVVVQNCITSVRGQDFSAVASPGNFIIHEEFGDNLDVTGSIRVNSNVPVTIQRYSDDEFMFDMRAVDKNGAKVLVTSNCQGNFFPVVSWDVHSIDVHIQGVQAGDPPLFIESSSYHAEWSYEMTGCTVPQESEALPARRRLNEGSANPLNAVFQASLHHATEALGRLMSSNACTVNVEIMLDGFSHEVDVTAPSMRVVDSEIRNTDYVHNPQNKCVVDAKTDIVFVEGTRRPRTRTPTRTPTRIPTLTPTYPPYSYDTFPPASAVPGRPFVDSSGNNLKAASLDVIPRQDKSWSNANAQLSVSALDPASLDNCTTVSTNHLRLSKIWRESALGEHASVASFSAFVIALMTNQAPSDLIEAALTAAMDEVRHAKTSFDIASRLSGIELQPGALPESTLIFGQDLKALALAVAKEGCVDETLSALEAAAEVEAISRVLAGDVGADDGSNKYYDINRDILVWIRDELRIIASEESSHAALAWRTFHWVCTIDTDACDTVKANILNKEEMDEAFHRRFSSFHFESEILHSMKESWSKLSSFHIEDHPNQYGPTDGVVGSLANWPNLSSKAN